MSAGQAAPAEWIAGGVHEVAPSVYRIPLPLPSDALRAVNVYGIDHGDSITLIDAGWAIARTAEVLERGLAELGHRFSSVDRILVTHVHRDHYSQAIELRRNWRTPVALGRGEAANLRAVKLMAEGKRESSISVRLRAAGAPDLARVIEAARPKGALRFSDLPDEWIDGRQRLELPSRSLDSVPTPGHTRGHTAFVDETARSMFAGDHLLPHITPSIGFEAAPAASPLADYLRSLAIVKRLPDMQLLPAHGPVTSSTHQRCDELLAHHDRRLDASAKAVALGSQTGLEVARQLTWTKSERWLDELDPYNQMLAVLETVAHLTVLVAQARIDTTRTDGVDSYQAAR
jgi:glyoxylase-like metal-dependent hydrolase (beta-lactamase superfamily II)